VLILSQYVQPVYTAELLASGGAVEKHVRNIFAKLDLPASNDDHRRVLAVLAFLRAGAG
jgi:DNA-binding NarL/FixJ family response regulator